MDFLISQKSCINADVQDIWFYSDPHFGHKNVIKYCKRPYRNIDEMHEDLIRRFNSVVKPGDIVFFLGDICFCGTEKCKAFISRLNGYKVLVRGNHDHGRGKMLAIGFNEVLDKWEGTIWWSPQEGTSYSLRLVMSHYPYGPQTWWQKFKMKLKGFDLRYLERRPRNDGYTLLHGHVHEHWLKNGNMINVGVDVWNYYPVNFFEVEKARMNKKKFIKNHWELEAGGENG